MCDETVDDSLAVLKFVLDWFVTSKTYKNFFTPNYADENILYNFSWQHKAYNCLEKN